MKIDTNNEMPLLGVEEVKDLGIMFDRHLKQHLKHLNSILQCVSKANQRIGHIRRNFTKLDKNIFITLFKSLVRLILMYGNTVWQPCFKQDSAQFNKEGLLNLSKP